MEFRAAACVCACVCVCVCVCVSVLNIIFDFPLSRLGFALTAAYGYVGFQIKPIYDVGVQDSYITDIPVNDGEWRRGLRVCLLRVWGGGRRVAGIPTFSSDSFLKNTSGWTFWLFFFAALLYPDASFIEFRSVVVVVVVVVVAFFCLFVVCCGVCCG